MIWARRVFQSPGLNHHRRADRFQPGADGRQHGLGDALASRWVVLSAVRPNSWLDRITGVLSVGTIAVPSFLVSIWALLVFSVIAALAARDRRRRAGQSRRPGGASDPARLRRRPRLGRLPGANGARLDAGGDGREPTSALPVPSACAGAGGLRLRAAVAILPTITLIGIGFGGLISATVFAEIIFSRPGIGKLIYDMVHEPQLSRRAGRGAVATALYIGGRSGRGLSSAWIDPRVREFALTPASASRRSRSRRPHRLSGLFLSGNGRGCSG